MAFAETYRSRRVLLTGHTGFKGAWLAEWLLQLGAEVTGYSLEAPTDPSLFELLGLEQRLRHVDGDVRDVDHLRAEMAASRPSVVFHLAAQAIVRAAYAQPRETFETNVMGTVNVLEAARACDSVEAVVIVTSDKSYQNLELRRPFRETDAMGGRDPYSASKGAAELVVEAYRQSFFAEDGAAAVASVRAGNVIGPGDWAADRIVPDIVRAVTAGEPVIVRNPDAVRPWQHVLEPLSGYLWLGARLLADRQAFSGPWNFGPVGDRGDRTVRWVVEQFLAAWGSGTWTTPGGGVPQPHEAHHLSVDSAKAREQLGWVPVWDAETAVRRTAEWHAAHHANPAGARQGIEAQLATYCADARAAGLPWATDGGRQA